MGIETTRQKMKRLSGDLGEVAAEIERLITSEEEARWDVHDLELHAGELERRVGTLEDLIAEFFLGVRDEDDLRQAVA